MVKKKEKTRQKSVTKHKHSTIIWLKNSKRYLYCKKCKKILKELPKGGD